MDSKGKSGYDYLITDANGTRKVINGVEYPVTEDDLPKKHQDSGCTECKFVPDANSILLYSIPRDLKEGVTNKPVFVGKFHMSGWTGHSGFYLFRCEYCESVSVDYPHGYTSFGLIYLRCNVCDGNLPLEASEERDVYKREGVPTPLATKKEREKEFMAMVGRFEKETGRKVLIVWRESFRRLFS